MAGDIDGARTVLEAAFDANPESEQIWLAAFKFEAQNGQWGVARQLLERARSVANTERVSRFCLILKGGSLIVLPVDLDEVRCI